MIDMKKVYESVSDKEDKLLELEDYLDVSKKLVDDYGRGISIPIHRSTAYKMHSFLGSETIGDYRYNMTSESVEVALSECSFNEEPLEEENDISYYLEEFFKKDTEDFLWFALASGVFFEVQEDLDHDLFLTKYDIADIEREYFNSNNLSASSYLFLYNKLKRLEDNDYDDFF